MTWGSLGVVGLCSGLCRVSVCTVDDDGESITCLPPPPSSGLQLNESFTFSVSAAVAYVSFLSPPAAHTFRDNLSVLVEETLSCTIQTRRSESIRL